MNVDEGICCHCAGCVSICPVDAIRLREVMITIDATKCTDCGICSRFCPVGALEGGKK